MGGDIHLENVQCEGSESRLEDCPMSGMECDHSQVAGVSCQGILIVQREMLEIISLVLVVHHLF